MASATAPTVVVPYYAHTTPNEDICLYRGLLTVVAPQHGATARVRGRVAVKWKPQPDLTAEISGVLGNHPVALFPGIDQIAVCPRFRRVPRQRTMRTAPIHGDVHLSLSISNPDVGLLGEAVPSVVMHVVNMERLFTGRLVVADGAELPDRLVLVGGGWNLTVDPSPNAYALQKQLAFEGGYALTHTVKAERADGSTISFDDALDLRDALTMFLRFGLGRSVAVVLPVGLRANGDAAWASWPLPSMDPLRGAWSWIGYENGRELESIWSAFITRWQDGYWELPLRLAVGYYIIANQPRPVNLAIGTAHSVLDMLAYSILVEERRLVSKRRFEARSATENLRALLGALSISSAVPAALTQLHGFRVGAHIADGPEIVVKLRNEMAHLRRNRKVRATPFLVEVWQLALWYAEMVLFRTLDFHGQYRSRLTGTLEGVP